MTDASTSIKALVRDLKEQHEELKDLIHDLDVWHESAKLVKALINHQAEGDVTTLKVLF